MERPKYRWVGWIKPLHSVHFPRSHNCSVLVFSGHIQIIWEDLNGENIRSFLAAELIGVEFNKDQFISIFILKLDMAFKHYRLDASIGASNSKEGGNSLSELFQHLECMGLPKQNRKLLFIVNPNSGKREANKIMGHILPIFRANGIEIVEMSTTHQGHAKEIMAHANISLYNGVVCVGGDGTINEAISGLLTNPRYRHSMDPPFPLGVIPAGALVCGIGILIARV